LPPRGRERVELAVSASAFDSWSRSAVGVAIGPMFDVVAERAWRDPVQLD
jgi:hypothetical protein